MPTMTKDQVARVIMQALTFLGEQDYTLQLKPGKVENTTYWIVALPQHREMVGLMAGLEADGFITSETQIKFDVLWTYLLKSHPESWYLTCLAPSLKTRLEADNAQLEWLTAAFLPEECSNEPLAILTRYYALREAARIAQSLDSAGGLDILAALTQALMEASQLELAARIYYKKVDSGQDIGFGG